LILSLVSGVIVTRLLRLFQLLSKRVRLVGENTQCPMRRKGDKHDK